MDRLHRIRAELERAAEELNALAANILGQTALARQSLRTPNHAFQALDRLSDSALELATVAASLPGIVDEPDAPISVAADPEPLHDAEELPTWEGVALVIEDNLDVRMVAERMLSLLGFEVLAAEDGRGGLDHVATNGDGIRLVLLDVTLPDLSGEEVLLELNDGWPNIPVLITSGYTQAGIEPLLQGDLAAGFVPKPFNLDSLAAAVEGVLG